MTTKSNSNRMFRRVGEVALVVVVAIAIAIVFWPRPSPAIVGDTPGPTQVAEAPSPAPSAAPASTPAETIIPTVLTEPTSESSPSAVPVPTGYTVKIDDGLSPSWTADAAAEAAYSRILLTEQLSETLRPTEIISVEVMQGRDVPDNVGGPFPDVSVAWVVHAYGTFVNAHGPTRYMYDEGWYIFNDDGFAFADAFRDPVKTIAPSE